MVKKMKMAKTGWKTKWWKVSCGLGPAWSCQEELPDDKRISTLNMIRETDRKVLAMSGRKVHEEISVYRERRIAKKNGTWRGVKRVDESRGRCKSKCTRVHDDAHAGMDSKEGEKTG